MNEVLYETTAELFAQLTKLLAQLTTEDYTTPGSNLFGATIGQHVRHIAELFVELQKGYTNGIVRYHQRDRDYVLETQIEAANHSFAHILACLALPDRILMLEQDQEHDSKEEALLISTTYYRELLYNIDHMVHHMALIRVGVQELTTLQLPDSFGKAAATIKHQQQVCAQ